MGVYLNPPDITKTIGKEIHGSSFNELKNQLNHDEVLIGLYDRFVFKNATQLYCEGEMHEMEQQVSQGIIKREGFFAVKISDAEKYSDGPLANQER